MKRFWQDVSIAEAYGGWRVMLDGRPIRTQRGHAQVLPTRALGELLAAEWSGQGEEVDPQSFVARDMADYAIDVVAPDRDGVVAKLLRYVDTDTLCYRADPDEPLHKRQWAVWEPLVAAFEAREGIRLERVSGVMHKPQPVATLATLRERLSALEPFTLAALESLTSLSASLTVGVSAIDPDADARALWNAAELEEAWQVEQWGNDALAEERRERRRSAFLQAVAFARAAGCEPRLA